MPEVVVVVGMHRSGTSVLTRGLKAAGLHLGDRLLPVGPPDNPKGYWEDTEVLRVNEILLNQMGCDEQSLRWFNEDDIERVVTAKLRDHAKCIVEERLSHTGKWAFKDPRTARLLPFWRSIFGEMGVAEKYVIALRNPLDSAMSYAHRNNQNKNRHPVGLMWGSLLWLEHLLASVHWLRDAKAVVVDYQNLLSNPGLEVSRVLSLLDIDSEISGNELENYSTAFVDKALQHFSSSDSDLTNHQEILQLTKDVYSNLKIFSVTQDLFNYSSNARFWEDAFFAVSSFSPAVYAFAKDEEDWRAATGFLKRLRYFIYSKIFL